MNDRGLGGNPTAINDAGQVLGNSDFGGFISSDGVFSYPSAIGELYAAGINNFGVISGTIDTSNDGNIGAIFYDGTAFHTVNCPDGTPGPELTGISNFGIIFGWCTPPGPNPYTMIKLCLNGKVPILLHRHSRA